MPEKIKMMFGELTAYWRVPATGDAVAYREYLMLSVGWLGMRLATVFGIGFGVNDPFTAMTLHMTHRDLLIFGYICTAIGYALAPLNAWIIDNLRSKQGKYRVFVKLGVPAGALSLFALFFPYEKLGYLPMVLSLFFIGQIQGYVQGWYSTGVSNLVCVISPNSQERVKILTVSSLVHNFAPSLTGLLIPVLSDVFANGDLYNIRTYRIIYPFFIVIGVALSMTAYYGVRERIVQPRARAAKIPLSEALRAVAKNKLFWIKSTDNWNNFMEDSKNVLMQWIFYYGKVGSMTTYGLMDTLSYNSSMWAMLASPWLISRLGKKGFKLVKNILQVFITLGLSLTYKKSLAMVFIFYFLNRFWETTEVIDRAMESDIRDYQQYLSGERIDGSFGVIDTYVGGAVGAVTNLFIPWVYKRNGFDGTDYSVLNVYNEDGSYNEGNVLYTLLDKLLVVSLIGTAIDVLPWFFYDLRETDQKAVVRVLRIRSAAEDRAAGVQADDTYCEACEAVFAMRDSLNGTKQEKLPKTAVLTKKERRAGNKEVRRNNEEIEIAAFVNRELNRYATPFGRALADFCREIDRCETQLPVLPKGETKEEKVLRADALRMARASRKNAAADGKPRLWARRHLLLCDAYENLNDFTADYPAAKARRDEAREADRTAAASAAEKRKREAAERKQKR